MTLAGNLNPATPATAGTWTSPFGDLSSFALLGGFPTAAVYGQASVVIGNQVFLLGGTTDGTTGRAVTTMVPITGTGVAYAETPVQRTNAMLQTGRFGATALRLSNSFVYLIGGRGSGGAALNSIEKLHQDSLVTQDSSQFATAPFSLTQARSHHAMAVAGTETAGALTNGRIYVIGGRDSAPLTSVEVNTVASGNAGAFAPAAYSLKVPRYGHAAVVTKKTGDVPAFLYVFGGRGADGDSLGSVERAPLNANGDLAGDFELLAGVSLDDPDNESRGRHGLSAAYVQGRLYLFGGTRSEAGQARLIDDADHLTIDPETGAVTMIARHHTSFTWGRAYYALALHGTGNLFVFGGTPDLPGSGPNPNVERALWR
ncbi:Kelch motif protein [compost metagenome]